MVTFGSKANDKSNNSIRKHFKSPPSCCSPGSEDAPVFPALTTSCQVPISQPWQSKRHLNQVPLADLRSAPWRIILLCKRSKTSVETTFLLKHMVAMEGSSFLSRKRGIMSTFEMGAPTGPHQPAEIPPPQSFQTGHASNTSSEMF